MEAAVRVADRVSLEDFMVSWRYHHKLQSEQLAYAGLVTTVEEVGFYHSGDPVYKLAGIPGCGWSSALKKGGLDKSDEFSGNGVFTLVAQLQ